MKNLLLLGATGILGSKFYELYNNKYNIIKVSRNIREDYNSIKGDISKDYKYILDKTISKVDYIDSIVNCAANIHLKNIHNSSYEDIKQAFEDNIVSIIYILKYLTKCHWADNENKKSVINISSTLSTNLVDLIGSYKNHYSYSIYGSSKAGLNTLVQYLSLELKEYNININCIIPGGFPNPIPTELICHNIFNLENSNNTGLLRFIYNNLSIIDKPLEYIQYG